MSHLVTDLLPRGVELWDAVLGFPHGWPVMLGLAWSAWLTLVWRGAES